MTAKILQLLNTGMQHSKANRLRLWIEPGVAMNIGEGAVMRLQVDREDDQHVVIAFVETRDGVHQNFKLSTSTWLDISAQCGAMAIPRAMEINANGSCARILMEFVTVSDKYKHVV